MSQLFRDLPIRGKLIVLMLIISGAVLSLAAGAFVLIEARSERLEIESELSTLASIIGLNSRAALLFGDREAAAKSLDALRLKPAVTAAWLLNGESKVFTRYARHGRAGDSLPAGPPEQARLGIPVRVTDEGALLYRPSEHFLIIYHPLRLDGEQVGMLVMEAALSELKARSAAFVAATSVILLLSALPAFLLASWLQRFVSRPIADLTAVMLRVSRHRDYGLRLKSRSEDEIGQLLAGFNAMLAEVEQRDRQLEEANLLLEQRVRERTEELDLVNRELLEKVGERQEAERALQESETRFRSLFENSPISLWEEDFAAVKRYLDGLRASGVEDLDAYFGACPEAVSECARLIRILDVNQATVRLLKAASKEDLLGNLDKIFTEESFGQFQRELVALSQGRTSIEIEGINKALDGELKFVNMRLSVVPGCEATLSRIIVSLVDLTERRRSEEALRMLGKALETTRVGITIANLQGEIIFTNPAEASMHGYEIGELLGQQVNILGPPELRTEFPGEKVQADQRESLNLRKDGGIFPVQLVSDLVADAAGSPLAVVTVCEDITERKETETRLKASLTEKDVLLREVHHRVKNNLQIISSLINLQMKKITEAKTRAELNATRNRIRSMALIHAKLYQSGNLSKINFAEYIEEFSRQLRSLFNINPKKVSLVLDIDAVYLGVDVAIPCGMIVNELLTNAVKYAFPEERKGQIRVVLRSEAAQTVLSVEDNGIGLPPEIDLEHVETLGLQLVHGLAQQIEGIVTVERSGGTRVVIRCPTADGDNNRHG